MLLVDPCAPFAVGCVCYTSRSAGSPLCFKSSFHFRLRARFIVPGALLLCCLDCICSVLLCAATNTEAAIAARPRSQLGCRTAFGDSDHLRACSSSRSSQH
eukprot:TRINITY_DN37705_c0_g1_i1.p2 TRINITY_DN37705_c0_g1~~TRINITY_DN37705_c0_g1_i1.p2  ORF type:complete len:101 (+),score=4.38 TRINITY_DN37705_c0_g1_i1:260-562(+)